MPKIERFEDLEIWKDARDLCKRVFEATSSGAFEKDFRFRDRIRASAGSIMDNSVKPVPNAIAPLILDTLTRKP